jgi:DNA relaxase NicK
MARVRRAVVAQYRGKLDTAIVELSGCAAEAQAHDWAAVEAEALQARGKVRFDQKEFALALEDFRGAMTQRLRVNSSTEELETSMIAIAVTESFLDGGSA